MKTLVFPGTFDPITNGHIDIIQRSLRLCDHLYVGIAKSTRKQPLFSVEERVDMARKVTQHLSNITIEPFDELVVNYVAAKGAHAVVRGLRTSTDFEYELQMAMINRKLHPSIETLFLVPNEEYSYLTSSAIKELATFSTDLARFVPTEVADRLLSRYHTSSS